MLQILVTQKEKLSATTIGDSLWVSRLITVLITIHLKTILE